jgi:TonB family protein
MKRILILAAMALLGASHAAAQSEVMPKFEGGGVAEFRTWVTQNTAYPRTAMDNGVSGVVSSAFTIDEKGRVRDVEIVSSPDKSLAKAVTATIEGSPRWEPATVDGVAAPKRMTLDVRFALGTPEKPHRYEKDGFMLEVQMPDFMGGGVDVFRWWVSQRVRYPAEAEDQKIQGRVNVKFAVDSDGSVTDVEAVGAPNPLLAAEAVRAVKTSPKWTPGHRQRFDMEGNLVEEDTPKVRFEIDLNFRLP